MSHLINEAPDKKKRYLEMNKRLEIHDVLANKFLEGCKTINGF